MRGAKLEMLPDGSFAVVLLVMEDGEWREINNRTKPDYKAAIAFMDQWILEGRLV